MAFELKRNDLRPRYRVQLTETDPNDTASQRVVDLTDADNAYMIMKPQTGGALKINRAAMDFLDRTNGVVEYTWVTGDTDTSGAFNIEVEINWDGEPQTFPSIGYFQVAIADDLG